MIRLMISRGLSQLGYSVVTAASGEEVRNTQHSAQHASHLCSSKPSCVPPMGSGSALQQAAAACYAGVAPLGCLSPESAVAGATLTADNAC